MTELPPNLVRMRALNDNEAYLVVGVPIGYELTSTKVVEGDINDRKKSVESFVYLRARRQKEFD